MSSSLEAALLQVMIPSNEPVQVFDPQKQTLLRQLRGHQRPVHTTRFAPDKMHVLSGSDDATASTNVPFTVHETCCKMWVCLGSARVISRECSDRLQTLVLLQGCLYPSRDLSDGQHHLITWKSGTVFY